MSVDKVLRLELLWAIKDASSKTARHLEYREHNVFIREPASPGWVQISIGHRVIKVDRRTEDLTDTLRALRDLDYLIDILDNINEPALKGY